MKGSLRRRALVSLVIAFFASAVTGCRTSQILRIDATLAPPPHATLEDLERAIRAAGSDLGWKIELLGRGRMKGTLRVRSHTAEVSIRYTKEILVIDYVSSENLMHSGDTIHRNYNHWVKNLEMRIKRRIALIS
jgi:hypothetical protein